MKTEPGEFVMLVPPSGKLARMRAKSSVPSFMSSPLMSMQLHFTMPSSPGSNVILISSEQKSADTPVPVPVIMEKIKVNNNRTKDSPLLCVYGDVVGSVSRRRQGGRKLSESRGEIFVLWKGITHTVLGHSSFSVVLIRLHVPSPFFSYFHLLTPSFSHAMLFTLRMKQQLGSC